MQFASRLILNSWLCTAPGEDFYGKNGVHGAGAKAGAVKGDVFEAGLFDSCGDCVEHVNGEGAREFSAREFNAGQWAVMTHAEFAKAELAQTFFRLFNLTEDFAGYGATVLDARGETGCGGAIPERIAGGFGECAYFDSRRLWRVRVFRFS